MAIEKTIELKVEAKEALNKLENIDESLQDIKKSADKTEKSTGSLEAGIVGVGLALKAIGIGVVLAGFNKLAEALMRNEAIADTLETVFNSIGVVFKLVTDSIVNTYQAVAKSSENFDAFGQVITNLLNIAIAPLKLAFQAIKLGIQSATLVWEQSFFGGKGKDVERIAELKAEIDSTKQAIKDTGQVAWDSGKAVVKNFGEAVGEVVNIGKTATEEFGKVFEDVTVKSILEQGKAITETRKNYELLALQQQRLVEQFDIDAESQRAIRDDVSRSIEDRINANTRLGEVLQEQNLAEQQAVDMQIASLRQRIDLEGESVELSNEIFSLETEKVAIQAKVKGFEAEQLTNINSLKQEQLDLDKLLNEQEREKVKIVATSMGQIADAIGKDTKAGKALAIGQALINTYTGVTAALKLGPWGIPASIGIFATGMKNVQAIRKTDVSGSTAPSTPPPSTGAIPETQGGISGMIPNLENITGMGTGEMQPVQAFVVENDISNAQALQEQLDLQSTL